MELSLTRHLLIPFLDGVVRGFLDIGDTSSDAANDLVRFLFPTNRVPLHLRVWQAGLRFCKNLQG